MIINSSTNINSYVSANITPNNINKLLLRYYKKRHRRFFSSSHKPGDIRNHVKRIGKILGYDHMCERTIKFKGIHRK